VARLGECSPEGLCLLWAEVDPIKANTFRGKICELFLTKKRAWAIFSPTHPVTLTTTLRRFRASKKRSGQYQVAAFTIQGDQMSL
jgi:hypothetical protein